MRYGRPVRDAGDATFRGTFRKVTRTFRRRFAGFTQGITLVSHTFHSVSRRFADVSRVSRQLSHTFNARFAVFRGRFASVTPAVTHVSRVFHGVHSTALRTFRKRYAGVSRAIHTVMCESVSRTAIHRYTLDSSRQIAAIRKEGNGSGKAAHHHRRRGRTSGNDSKVFSKR